MGNYHARFYEGLGRGDTPSLLSSGNNSQFVYDPKEHLVKINEFASNTQTSLKQFTRDDYELLEARDSSSAVTGQYFAYGQSSSGSNYFYSKSSPPETVRELSSPTGQLSAQYSYDPFGRQSQIQGTLSSDFEYAGYYYHQRSQLSLTVNRGYSAQLGRWISRDPIAEKGGINLYTYVQNKPINLTDPTGLSIKCDAVWWTTFTTCMVHSGDYEGCKCAADIAKMACETLPPMACPKPTPPTPCSHGG